MPILVHGTTIVSIVVVHRRLVVSLPSPNTPLFLNSFFLSSASRNKLEKLTKAAQKPPPRVFDLTTDRFGASSPSTHSPPRLLSFSLVLRSIYQRVWALPLRITAVPPLTSSPATVLQRAKTSSTLSSAPSFFSSV
ncbi:hypothetical protein V6N12_065519 [Hibiscus sabdariffa]|uniref:Uncharacterized protein n=1 Tax=Hibiscus sabdariffa TaxID=183260 RepID=A0ABR2G8Z1_9ROSI